MDPDGSQTADGSTVDDNVVRLPRDWLGPRDELVPFGPSANGQSAQALPTASDFWGEQSSALQSALEAPPQTVPTRTALPRRAWLVGVAAAVLLGAVAFVVAGHHPSAGVPRASSMTGGASYLAIKGALESTATAHARADAGLRQTHRSPATSAHRSARAGRRSRPRTVIVEQVRYVTAPTQTSATASPPSSATSSPHASSESSSPAAGSVNQPAVGANGALGPGTSPDG